MAIIPYVNSHSLQLCGHCVDQHNLPMQSKMLYYNLNYLHYSAQTPSISLRIQNCSTFPQFPENPSQKLITKHGVLSNKPVNDISSVSKLIREFTDNGLFEDAIRAYRSMLDYGFPVEEFRYFPCLIKAFGRLSDTEMGRLIHGHVLKLGFLDDIYVMNSVLGMYFECGAVKDAVKLFEKMHRRDIVSWNTMISGFCRTGDYMGSLVIFRRMIQEHDVYPNRVACLSALSSSTLMESLSHGREIHGFLIKVGLDVDEFLVSGLIELYMKCADVRNAEHVYKSILNKESVRVNTVIWNVIISGYVFNGRLSPALELFIEMQELGIKPDSSTVVAVLGLCSHLLDLEVGKQIHGFIVSLRLESDARVETALINMYLKCGDPETGLKIFQRSQNCDLVMWGTVISDCALNGCPNEAMEVFHNFMFEYGFPDSVIILAVLRVCSSSILKPKGMEIHGLTVKMGFDSKIFVGGALVDMYAKCRDMESAQKVFYGLPLRDLVSWNALISGYSQNEFAADALKAFRDMQSEQVRPNSVTAACILSACAHLSVINFCKEVHCYLLRRGFGTNILVSNSLIATYAKCGDINSSHTIFEKMPERNEVSWNSIILGFGIHGQTDEMYVIFGKMKEAGIKPDHATFTALLSACSHAGRVDMGWKYFKSMIEDYYLEPQIEQYTCMVDLLGRAGHVNQAYNLVMAMPCVPDDCIWGSLLGSCKRHGDEKLAELVANHIFELDPTNTGYRVLLANLYEDFGKWTEVTRVRSEIKDMGLKKQPGCSWIEVNNNIHIFIAGDCSHHQSEEIYAAIESLTLEIGKAE